MKNPRGILILLFILIVLAELLACWMDYTILEYIVKPLIMIWMASYFLIFSGEAKNKWMVLMAFFFSISGDVLLMLADKMEILFYAGVGGFFLAQLSYILVFAKYFGRDKKGFIRTKPLILLPYLLYLAVVLIVLVPVSEGIMQVIIVIYGCSLIGMAIAAGNLKGKVFPSTFKYLFWGSTLFVISDTLLAVNKFHTELPKSAILIMSTYIAAQFLIMMGLTKKKS